MILLQQSATTSAYFTLSELTTLTATTYYMFDFQSDDTQEHFYFTAPDVSTNQLVYNQFDLTLTGSAYTNLTAGTINLPYLGFYTYKAYQQYNNTNYNLSGVTGDYLECGKVYVSGDSLYNVTNEYTGSTSLYVFNP